MDRIRTILVIVDPTRAEQPAVGKAAYLAKKVNAQLELFACDTKASLMARRSKVAPKHPSDGFVTDLRPYLESLAGPLREQGLTVTTNTIPLVHSLPAALLKWSRESMADMVVKDTHHHSIARRTIFSNTDWQLIRECPVPLLLVKARSWREHPHIVAAVDPGHVNDKPMTLDARLLDYASFLAEHLSGELHVAHAYLPEAILAQTLAGGTMVNVLSPETLLIEEQRHRSQISALLSDCNIAPANVHVKAGSPIEMLTELADSLAADITVMGAISRSGVGRAFIGSTAEDILEQLPCDALIVKTPDFGESLPF